MGISEKQFAPVCVVIDKLDKIGPDEVKAELSGLEVPEEVADKILTVMASKTVEEMEEVVTGVGVDAAALDDLKKVFQIAEEYGFRDWLIFDASVVRGLA